MTEQRVSQLRILLSRSRLFDQTLRAPPCVSRSKSIFVDLVSEPTDATSAVADCLCDSSRRIRGELRLVCLKFAWFSMANARTGSDGVRVPIG